MTLPEKYDWVQMNPELETALDLIINSEDHLNILGPAGVGKTVLLKMICDNEVLPRKNVVVLSSTGIAAVNASSEGIIGSTIHSFFNLGAYSVYTPGMMRIDNRIYEVVNNIDIIVIDEISMVTSNLLDFVIETLRFYRSKQWKDVPRIILFGDILQLPPVINNKDENIKKFYHELYNDQYMYFNASNFKDLAFKTIHLNTIYRQTDTSFQQVLNRVRQATHTMQDLNMLNQYHIAEEDFFDKHENYLYIATTNATVDKINAIALDVLDTEEKTYNAIITGKINLNDKKMLPTTVRLKKDIQVMCIKNATDGSYKNGTMGKVLSLHDDTVYIKLSNGRELDIPRTDWAEFDYVMEDGDVHNIKPVQVGNFNQISLKSASAITTHKCQGQTLETAYIDLEQYVFADGLTYVALSRLKSLDGLGLKRKIRMTDIRASKEALDFLSHV